jgi:RNA polymerase sigma-70 factor (ECF subfamily)
MSPISFRNSSKRSFETLYERESANVYRYALALLGSPADAEDVTQATFLNAYRAMEGGERPRNPRAWLRTIALNVCRQRFRQAARSPSEVPLDEELPGRRHDDEGPTLDEVTEALKHLPFNQRAALVMREFGGLAPPEIATEMGLSVSAVETLLFRARRSLREQIEGSLTCEEAERAISLQLDGRLARGERGALRAHLRQCDECARIARGVRAQRSALRALAASPVPASLGWFAAPGPVAAGVVGAGGGVAAGAPLIGPLAAKLLAAAVTAAVATGVGHEAIVDRGTATSKPAGREVRAVPAAAVGSAPSPVIANPVVRSAGLQAAGEGAKRTASRKKAKKGQAPRKARGHSKVRTPRSSRQRTRTVKVPKSPKAAARRPEAKPARPKSASPKPKATKPKTRKAPQPSGENPPPKAASPPPAMRALPPLEADPAKPLKARRP